MTGQHALFQQTRLIRSLAEALNEETCHQVQYFETHLSWVLVAGNFAYKLKKAVRFPFVDFSRLAARRFYCHEELRLNRRLAPEMYLSVVAITGSPDVPVIDGTGTVIEYGVKMHSFAQHMLWSHRITAGLLSSHEVDSLAKQVAQFHLRIPTAPGKSRWGSVPSIQESAAENFAQLSTAARGKKQLADLANWEAAQQTRLKPLFRQRKAAGFVRECHGDLHSENILTQDGRVIAFDCIEFNKRLRWIDVLNDIAFIHMDLEFHGRPCLAARFLNAYLAETGDYEGLPVFHYYRIQRALVRSKVASLRTLQLRAESRDPTESENRANAYLEFAAEHRSPRSAAIIITHGFSGSGKSSIAQMVVEPSGAVQLRSDIERKRLPGLAAAADTMDAAGSGIYDPAVTALTYRRLLMLARTIVSTGIPVVVDATFLASRQRQAFRDLAGEMGIPFFIFDFRASEAILKARIVSRLAQRQDPSDAGLQTLAYQIKNNEPLADNEMEHVIAFDTEHGISKSDMQGLVVPVLQAIRHRD
jgi:aminoglycoside phosphotransferase family enzyme/predicted kinase